MQPVSRTCPSRHSLLPFLVGRPRSGRGRRLGRCNLLMVGSHLREIGQREAGNAAIEIFFHYRRSILPGYLAELGSLAAGVGGVLKAGKFWSSDQSLLAQRLLCPSPRSNVRHLGVAILCRYRYRAQTHWIVAGGLIASSLTGSERQGGRGLAPAQSTARRRSRAATGLTTAMAGASACPCCNSTCHCLTSCGDADSGARVRRLV